MIILPAVNDPLDQQMSLGIWSWGYHADGTRETVDESIRRTIYPLYHSSTCAERSKFHCLPQLHES